MQFSRPGALTMRGVAQPITFQVPATRAKDRLQRVATKTLLMALLDSVPQKLAGSAKAENEGCGHRKFIAREPGEIDGQVTILKKVDPTAWPAGNL